MILPSLRIGLLSAIVASSASAQLSFFGSPNQNIDLDGQPIGTVVTDSQTLQLGGVSTTRTLTGTVTATLNPVSIQGYVFDGIFGLSQGGGDATNLALEWGANADMNLNLTTYGDQFQFSHWSNDGVTGSQVVITVWNGTNSFTAPVTTLTHTNFGGPATSFDYSVPFSSFPGADFTSIDRISFTMDAAVAADAEIANFQVIPEPSAALIGGLGVLCLLRRRRSAGV